MRSHLEFRSAELFDSSLTSGMPGGENVAKLLSEKLTDEGYRVESVAPEDWGWRVQLSNARFPLWVGCGHYPEYSDGFLCFIEPSKTYVRRWFRRVSTEQEVERLAASLERIFGDCGLVSNLRWWTDDEVAAST